ncbi:MAG: hypothetical protein QOF58_1206 [Pseudonocardiales bacterium]|jgi:predicted ester cyclase|nr:hypothetical protein [Pseudonocardiales bacterium]
MTTDSEVVLRYVDYLATGDESILDEAFAPDFHDHVSGRRGTDIMRIVRGWMEKSFADMTNQVHAVTEGDGVVMIWFSGSGTHVGSEFPQFAGKEPTGRRIVFEAVHIFRVRDGKMSEHWAVRDDLGVLRQLDGGDAPPERPLRP